jgi:hypothetical protein
MRQKNMLRCLVPLLGLALLAILGALYAIDFKNYYRALATGAGMVPFKYPFVDWEYVSANIKCWNEGINVYITNPCDVLDRVYNLSPLWLRAIFIPTDRAWTMPIGIGIILAFLLSLFWLVKPANWRELIIFALTCTSPMVVEALERGNVDVIIFIMLVVAGALSAGPLANRILSYALMLLAGLLKFYPLIVLSTALRERPRIFFTIAAAAGLIIVGFLYRFREELTAALENLPNGGFGAVDLPFDGPGFALRLFPGFEQFGWFTALPYALMAALLIVTAIQVIHLVRNGNLVSTFARIPDRDAIFLVIGAALIAGCFFTGRSVAHRGVHLIFIVVGLVAMQRAADNPATRATLTRAIMIVLFLTWERIDRPYLPYPYELPGPGLALYAFLLIFLIDQILWWRLAALLLAFLAIFGVKSEFFAALQQRRGRAQIHYPR